MWANSCAFWYSPGVLVQLVRAQSCGPEGETQGAVQNFPGRLLDCAVSTDRLTVLGQSFFFFYPTLVYLRSFPFIKRCFYVFLFLVTSSSISWRGSLTGCSSWVLTLGEVEGRCGRARHFLSNCGAVERLLYLPGPAASSYFIGHLTNIYWSLFCAQHFIMSSKKSQYLYKT